MTLKGRRFGGVRGRALETATAARTCDWTPSEDREGYASASNVIER